MTLLELKQHTMFQVGADSGDMADFHPHLTNYLNEGYQQFTLALYGQPVSADGDYPPLRSDRSTPQLPLHMHRALAEYASWMICRSGSAQKQSRGAAFLRAFENALSLARLSAGGRYIVNIPK